MRDQAWDKPPAPAPSPQTTPDDDDGNDEDSYEIFLKRPRSHEIRCLA